MSEYSPRSSATSIVLPSSYQTSDGTLQPNRRLFAKKRRKQKDRFDSIISLPVSSVSAFSGFTAVSNYSSVRPTRSKTSLFLNGFVMLGREYCYAIEASMTTPILLSIGLPVHLYSLVWVISPILGFILQPIIGNMSDRCKSRWGRRRPFILALAILLVVGMTFFLNGEQFVKLSAGSQRNINDRSLELITILVTVAGVVVFDFSADFIEGPIRAYIMDVCDNGDVKIGLYYQAIFTGLGGALGYASGGVPWMRGLGLDTYFVSDQQVVYVLAMVIFVSTVAMNLISIPEKRWVGQTENSKKSEQSDHKSRKRSSGGSEAVIEEKEIRENLLQNGGSIRKFDINNNSDDSNLKTFLTTQVNVNHQPLEIVHSRRTRKPRNTSLDIYGTFKSDDAGQRSTPGFQRNQQSKRIKSRMKSRTITDDMIRHEELSKGLLRASAKRTAQWVNRSSKTKEPSTNYVKDRRMFPRVIITPIRLSNQANQLIDCHSDSDSFQSSDGPVMFETPPSLKDAMQQEAKKDKCKINNRLESPLLYSYEEQSSYRQLPTPRSTPKEMLRRVEADVKMEKSTSDQGNVQSNGIKRFLITIYQTPKEIKLLCIAHLFGWMAFLCVVLFFTDFVGQEVFGGDPRSPLGSTRGDAYKQGIEIGSWGMAINAAASSAYCFLLKPMIQRFGARTLYVFGYFAFALGAMGMAVFRTVNCVLILASLIGVMSATLYTLPYFLISKYHEGYKRLKGTPQERGVGADCALVTCMIQLAQIIIGLGIGGLVTWLETATVTVAAGSIISLIGSVYVMFWVEY